MKIIERYAYRALAETTKQKMGEKFQTLNRN